MLRTSLIQESPESLAIRIGAVPGEFILRPYPGAIIKQPRLSRTPSFSSRSSAQRTASRVSYELALEASRPR